MPPEETSDNRFQHKTSSGIESLDKTETCSEDSCASTEDGTIGRILTVTEKGFVVVAFLDQENNELQSCIEFQLDELQFYAGTKFLKDFLQSWPWADSYVMKCGPCTDSMHRSPNLHPRVLKLYQDFPHGRVYINRQIQLEIHQKISVYSKCYLNDPQEAVFLKVQDNGDLLFQSFLPFRDHILNYLKSKPLPPPETRETLMMKTEVELRECVYVARYPVDGSLQRILIRKVIWGKNEILVNFMDLGLDAKIKIVEVYEGGKIDWNYARFPGILVRCHLKGVVHVDVGACRKELNHQFAYIELAKPLEDLEDPEVLPQVNVYVRKKDGRVRLNESLVLGGFAIPEITRDQVSVFRKSQESLTPVGNKPAAEKPARINGMGWNPKRF